MRLLSRLFPSARPTPALFLHIQKTAGSTLIHLLREHYGQNMVSHGDYLTRSTDELARIAFVSGHFGFDFAQPLFEGRYTFTFLRDPVERVLSFYRFCRSRSPDEFPIYRFAHENDLDAFLEAGFEGASRSYVWNHQTWSLAVGPGNPEGKRSKDIPQETLLDLAKTHLESFSFVGFTETFEDDRNAVLSALGISPPPERTVINASRRHGTPEPLPQATRRRLDALTELDRALYDHAIRIRQFR